MITTFNWAVTNLERQVDDGFVFVAHYTVNAYNGIHTSGAYGSLGFERPDKLIPYDQLTEEQLVSWVKEKLGCEKVAEVEKALQAHIEEQQYPTKATGIPWHNTTDKKDQSITGSNMIETLE